MSLYKAYIANDQAKHKKQVSVVWDDNDPNRFITAPFPIDEQATEDDLAAALGRAGYRVVSTDSDNLGRGWAMVARSSSQHSFYDPVSAGWYAYLTDEQKDEIRRLYPDAAVPGVSS